ncbi:MAG: hypothetical protein ACOCXJ_00885 [Planctomycetota bacterium]
MKPLALSLLPLLLILLGLLLQRSRAAEQPAEEEGVVIYRGSIAEAQAAIDRLADAGVAAWIDEEPGTGVAVAVSAAVADQIPHLLRADPAADVVQDDEEAT